MNHRHPASTALGLAVSLVGAVLLLALPLAILAAPSASGETVHVVQRGEYLGAIALRYGVSVPAVMQSNAIADANRIYIGQRLVIPSSDVATYGINGPSSSYYSGGCTEYYRVRPGDYLGKIAQQFGVSVPSIQEANGIWGSLIFPGTRLKIPCGGSGADSSASSAVAAVPAMTCPLSSGRYLIRPGDTLMRIALRCGTSVAALRRANALGSDLIYAGQWLVVSSYDAPVALPASTSQEMPIAHVPSVTVVAEQPTPTPTRVFIRDTALPTPTPSY